MKAINTARARARARVWALVGVHAHDPGASAAAPLVIDIDATLVTAHSEKESAATEHQRAEQRAELAAERKALGAAWTSGQRDLAAAEPEADSAPEAGSALARFLGRR